MTNSNNSEASNKVYPHAQSSKKYHPQIDAQWLILENIVVSRLQNEVAHANTFDLRSFRLRLEMEEEEVVV